MTDANQLGDLLALALDPASPPLERRNAINMLRAELGKLDDEIVRSDTLGRADNKPTKREAHAHLPIHQG